MKKRKRFVSTFSKPGKQITRFDSVNKISHPRIEFISYPKEFIVISMIAIRNARAVYRILCRLRRFVPPPTRTGIGKSRRKIEYHLYIRAWNLF